MDKPNILIICATSIEARPIRALFKRKSVNVLTCGIKFKRNLLVDNELLKGNSIIINAGFGGGLNPQFKRGVIAVDGDEELLELFTQAGAKKAHIVSTSKLLWTSYQKQRFGQITGAEVVDMESDYIKQLCKSCGIKFKFINVRIISDGAEDDMPVDFSKFFNRGNQIEILSLIKYVLLRPKDAIKLAIFGARCIYLANRLAKFLFKALTQGKLM